MASPFNQAGGAFGSKPFAFGTPTQTGFGAPSTPAFGATPAVSFGASTPSFSLPSSTSAPGFGATPAGSSPSLFNTSAAPLFGATPSFGQSSTPGFGQNSSPAMGSFASGFSFATGSAFASPTPASPFGSMPSGLSPAGQQSSTFGQITQMAPVAFSSGAMPDAATKEIQEIRAAYTPSNPAYKFQHLFLNVVDNPGSRLKPQNVDEIRWRQVLAQAGGASNPDKLWPVLATGFKDLLLRASAQNAAIDENQQRLKSLTELGHRMSRQQMMELKRRTGDVQKRHIELSNRLLRVTRLLDALESRLASSLGYQGELSCNKEQLLSRQLSIVEAEVSPSSFSGLQRRLESVAAAARLRSRDTGGGARGTGAHAKLDDKSLQQLFAVLKEHAEGIKHLQDVLKRDQMDVQILRGG